MAAIDPISTAHGGATRASPPGTGAEPVRDATLRAHRGYLALFDGTEPTDDQSFCIRLADDQRFRITPADDQSFCVVLADDQRFPIRINDDGSVCVVLDDDKDFRI